RALSGRNRDYRERRHEPASYVGNHGDGPRPSHDGIVRPACAGRIEIRARRKPAEQFRHAMGADLDAARAELRTVYGGILADNPAEYPTKSNFQIDAKLLRDQLTAPART